MKKFLIPLVVIPLGAYSFVQETTDTSDFINSENKKEFTYEVYPDLVFWNEGGRSYWRENGQLAYSTLEFKTIPRSVALFFKGESPQTQTIEENIYFKHNQARLTDQGREKLSELISDIKTKKDNVDKIVIEGFASRPGSEEYNMQLSEKRAKAVKEFFTANGIEKDVLEISANGENHNINSEEKSRSTEVEVKGINLGMNY